MKKHFLLLLLLLVSISIPALSQNKKTSKGPKVTISNGELEGILLPSGIKNYRGIPYAKPPMGNLRWKEPQPVENWKEILKADTFGNRPMQMPVFADMNFRSATVSEDCLYLNVWTPAKNAKEKLPVLVYFYGGGYIAGDGSEYRYDGESLAEKGIVTVTLNYRLGIFGFFVHPELSDESPNGASGNYGLLDQHAALLWVKNNIAAFGGDPNKITIAGESAGSISVSAHMASPLSKKLIAGAIGQSGAMIHPTLEALPLEDAEKNGIGFARTIGSGTMSELRALSAKELMEMASKPGAFKARATLDGYFLPKLPAAVFAAGDQARVPLLAGWTSAEMPYNAFMQGKEPTPENYAGIVTAKYGDSAGEVLALYPGTTNEEVMQSTTALASDNFIVYSTWKWAEDHRRTSKKSVFVYTFSKGRPSLITDSNKAAPSGAPHASDIEYALGNLASNKVYNWTADDLKASEYMENYFANFIKTGNPNGQNLPSWPASGLDGAMDILDLNAQPRAGKEPYRSRYVFFEEYYKTKK